MASRARSSAELATPNSVLCMPERTASRLARPGIAELDGRPRWSRPCTCPCPCASGGPGCGGGSMTRLERLELLTEPGSEAGNELGSDVGSEPGSEPGSEAGTEDGNEVGNEFGSEDGIDGGSEPGSEPDINVSGIKLDVRVDLEGGSALGTGTGRVWQPLM